MAVELPPALSDPSTQSRTGPELSIVLPCLNEAETLAHCIRQALAAIQAHGISGEVVVADNGSTDGSQAIALREGARLVPVPVRGYGAALMAGIQAARGRFVLMGDADASYDFGHAPRFLAPLRSGADLVMGNRFQGGIAPGAMPWLHRYLGNPVLSLLGRRLFHVPTGDFHCGLRAFHRERILQLNLRTTGMEFASEMVVKCALARYRVEQVPTTLQPDGRSRPPHLRTWRDGWRHLCFLLLYSPRWLFLYPGLAIMLVCGAIAALLIAGPLRVGAVVYDVDTLVYCVLAFLIGAQAVGFFYGAQAFAVSEGLLPESAFSERTFRLFRFEVGLAIGAFLTLAGLAGTAYAIHRWRAVHFGNLDPVGTLRLTLPSAAAIALGLEIILFSFFLSILFIKRK
jgi:glycosyltransferase involved in cell wall biosynthesis